MLSLYGSLFSFLSISLSLSLSRHPFLASPPTSALSRRTIPLLVIIEPATRLTAGGPHITTTYPCAPACLSSGGGGGMNRKREMDVAGSYLPTYPPTYACHQEHSIAALIMTATHSHNAIQHSPCIYQEKPQTAHFLTARI
ncbi:hypothetical protein IWX50DRAFT_642684 [Phyllosticta citricarpa]|uniref:Secreted protein n=1 Tax=Phyllosticta citricarpa TaxID=55181 RepID=A0ABR1LRW9_9PEZI